MKFCLLFICSILAAQDFHQGEVTFDYSGSVSGSFLSFSQDSIITGFAFNQEGADTSYFIMGGVAETGNGEFDLFITLMQDSIFPVQPRTWDIPGQGDSEDPLSMETIVVFLPGVDSVFVEELISIFPDTVGDDSLNLDTLITGLFLGLSSNLFFGIDGEMEISEVTDSTIVGEFSATLYKPLFSFLELNDGLFVFNKTSLPMLELERKPEIPERLILYPAYPNPFNPVTTIKFSVISSEIGSLQIFDITGRVVESLFTRRLIPGEYEIEWHAGNYPNGVYFAMLKTGNYIRKTKLVLLK